MQPLLSKLGFVKTGTTALTAAAQEKVNSLLADYKEVIGLLKQLGIKVDNFQVTTGVGVPQITTRLSGSIGELKADDMKQMMESKVENQLLGLMLKPLLTVKEVQENNLSELDDVTINVSLGLPPKVTVNLS